ncbi:MAG: putative toxin-antitoxin system toxin component, PIN family [Phycisphaerales bacterium]
MVLDTNVLFAGAATRGLCEALVGVCLQGHTIVLSEHILAELRGHLTTKLKMPGEQARRYEELLREEAEIVEPIAPAGVACPDPDDIPVLGTAVAGRAGALVTGDAALLAMKKVEGIPILSPREFYDRLR